jgi:hypothetical protein
MTKTPNTKRMYKFFGRLVKTVYIIRDKRNKTKDFQVRNDEWKEKTKDALKLKHIGRE